MVYTLGDKKKPSVESAVVLAVVWGGCVVVVGGWVVVVDGVVGLGVVILWVAVVCFIVVGLGVWTKKK